MGTYDDVHSGDRCGQTKALGKFLRHLVPGSRAQVFPAPANESAGLPAGSGDRGVSRTLRPGTCP